MRRARIREDHAAGLITINPRYPAWGGGFEVYWTAEREMPGRLFWTFGTAPTVAVARSRARAYLDAIA